MHNKIIICGGNGSGKSTLGKVLADKLNYKFMDIEDYYFPKSESDYPYDTAQTSPNGDLYKKEKKFLDMVQNRSEQDVEDWLKSTRIPVIQVDGTNTVPHNIEIIIDKISPT